MYYFTWVGSPGQNGLQNELTQWLSPGLLKDPVHPTLLCLIFVLASSAFWQQDGHSSLGSHVQMWQCLQRKGEHNLFLQLSWRLKSFSRSAQISLHVSLAGIRSHNHSWIIRQGKWDFPYSDQTAPGAREWISFLSTRLPGQDWGSIRREAKGKKPQYLLQYETLKGGLGQKLWKQPV